MFNKKSLIGFLKAFYHSHRRVPTRKDLNTHPDMPSYSTYRKFFGSYSDAIRQAGYKPAKRKITNYQKKTMLLKSHIAMEKKKIKEWKEKPRRKNKEGFIVLYKPFHPNSNSYGYIFEHRFVMSQHLKRPLKRNEQVYHKNGKRDDNRIANLTLKK